MSHPHLFILSSSPRLLLSDSLVVRPSLNFIVAFKYAFKYFLRIGLKSSHKNFSDFNRISFLSHNYREIYSRVLECILQTELPELMLNHKDEILATLDTIAHDTGKWHVSISKWGSSRAELARSRFVCFMSVHVYGENRKSWAWKYNK